MLTYESHPQEIQKMQDIINSGKFFSVTFVKSDGTVRFVNGRKINYQSDSPESEKRGKYDRTKKNILLIWDNNKINPKTNKRGVYISAKLNNILFFKSGSFVKDYTDENIEAIEKANITSKQLEDIKHKMKINDVIKEETDNFIMNEMVVGIPGLEVLFRRYNYPPDLIKMVKLILNKEYKEKGDAGVVEAVKNLIGTLIEPMGNKRYLIPSYETTSGVRQDY